MSICLLHVFVSSDDDGNGFEGCTVEEISLTLRDDLRVGALVVVLGRLGSCLDHG